MSCQWGCPACNEVAFWYYTSPHACGRGQEDDEGSPIPLTTADDECEPLPTEERQ